MRDVTLKYTTEKSVNISFVDSYGGGVKFLHLRIKVISLFIII